MAGFLTNEPDASFDRLTQSMPPLAALPTLAFLLWAPAAAAALGIALPARRDGLRRSLGVGASLLVLALAVETALRLGSESEVREIWTWIAPLGASYDLRVDGLGVWFLLWIPLVATLSLIAERETGGPLTTGLILVAETGLLGMVLSGDALLYAGFFGTAVLAFTLLARASGAMKRFFFFQSLGLSLVLAFLLLCFHDIFVQTGFPSGDLSRVSTLVMYPAEESRWWALGFLAVLPALPLFPFSSWVESAVEGSSTRGRLFLLGGFSVVGALFLTRVVEPALPAGAPSGATMAATFGALSLLFAGIFPYRGAPRRFWVPLLVGLQGWTVLGLVSLSPEGVAAGRLSIFHTALAVTALALASEAATDDEESPVSRGAKLIAFGVVLGVLVLPSLGANASWTSWASSPGWPTWWIILREQWGRSPGLAAVAALGWLLLIVRLLRGVPTLARGVAAGASSRRRRWLLVPLLFVWIYLAAAPDRLRKDLAPAREPSGSKPPTAEEEP